MHHKQDTFKGVCFKFCSVLHYFQNMHAGRCQKNITKIIRCFLGDAGISLNTTLKLSFGSKMLLKIIYVSTSDTFENNFGNHYKLEKKLEGFAFNYFLKTVFVKEI